MIHVEIDDNDMMEVSITGNSVKLSKEFAALLIAVFENNMKDLIFSELDNIIREGEKK